MAWTSSTTGASRARSAGRATERAQGDVMTDGVKVRTCLWFDDNALQAAEFYCGLLPDSRVERVERYPEGAMGEPGQVAGVDFTLAGTPYQAINGGDHFKLDRGRLDRRRDRGPGGDRSSLGGVDRGRWCRKPMRLAEGPVRTVLADRTQAGDRVDARTRCRPGLGRAQPDEEDRRRGAGSRRRRSVRRAMRGSQACESAVTGFRLLCLVTCESASHTVRPSG